MSQGMGMTFGQQTAAAGIVSECFDTTRTAFADCANTIQCNSSRVTGSGLQKFMAAVNSIGESAASLSEALSKHAQALTTVDQTTAATESHTTGTFNPRISTRLGS